MKLHPGPYCLKWLRFFFMAHLYGIFIFTLTTLSNENQINPINGHLGWINPNHNATILVGYPLRILCTINSDLTEIKNYSSSNLVFYRNQTELVLQNVTKVNETTLSLYLSNKEESIYLYECYLTVNKTEYQMTSLLAYNRSSHDNDHLINDWKNVSSSSNNSITILIGYIRVCVGYGPKKIENFRCTRAKYENTYSYRNHYSILNCSWDRPENYFKTEYIFHYRVEISESSDDCEKEYKDTNFCILAFCGTSDCCRFQYINITITGANMFQTIEQSFWFNELKNREDTNVIFRLSALQINLNTVTLSWFVSDRDKHCATNWIYQKSIKKDDSDWSEPKQILFFNVNPEGRISHNISGLTLNTTYAFRIRAQASGVPSSEQYWSEFSENCVFQLQPPIPAYKLETGVGLFQNCHVFNNNKKQRSVLIGLKPVDLSELIFHGDLLEHVITVFDSCGKSEQASKLLKTNKYVATIGIDPLPHNIAITTTNMVGQTIGISRINVAAWKNEVEFCSLFFITNYFNGTYELTWLPPEALVIVNYTLFWCWINDSQSTDISSCVQSNWTYVSANTTKTKLLIDSGPSGYEVKSKWNFFISANADKASSGLLRSMQTVFSSGFQRTARSLPNEMVETFPDRTIIPKGHPKTATYSGRKFSQSQFNKWIYKLHVVEH